ncbi:MAG TPA: hypothetical protein VJU79_02865, partial [Candidatus Dormibacteraeota bacterium]|nr:hypothetical protein [Candidatus Dormibacteraeota bacterium]
MQRQHEHTPETADPAQPVAAPVPVLPTVATVLALQQSAGNRATTAVLARQPKPAHAEKFVIGSDISLPLAKRAQELAGKALGDAQLRELHDLALQTDESVDDDERLFITALLEAGNAERLTAAKVRSGEKLELTLALDKTTKANLQKVIDIGRPDLDPAVTSALKDASDAKGDKALADKATKRAEDEASKQILKLAGAGGKKRATPVIAYAKANGVAVTDVLGAMINAASDSTAG